MIMTLNMIAGYMREEWTETYSDGEVNRSMIYPFAVSPTTPNEISRRHYFMRVFREMSLHNSKYPDHRDSYILIN